MPLTIAAAGRPCFRLVREYPRATPVAYPSGTQRARLSCDVDYQVPKWSKRSIIAAMATYLDARSLLEPLVGHQILTVRGRPNTVLGLTETDVIVGTDRSPDGELVPIEAVQSGLDRLLEAGEIEVHPRSLGYRSSFVGALLPYL